MRFVPMYPFHFLNRFCSSTVAPGVPIGQSLRYEGQVLGIVLAMACLSKGQHTWAMGSVELTMPTWLGL